MEVLSKKDEFIQQTELLEAYVNNLDKDLTTANIIVAGITGTGKSTLINAVFGSELAATGEGRPVTENIREYNNKDIPIKIWDTVGFEMDEEKRKKAIKQIRDTIVDKSELSDLFDRIHAIWYCVCAEDKKYQTEETDFVKTLYSLGLPFIIVLTKAISPSDSFEKSVREINNQEGLGDINVISVLAKEYPIRGLGNVPAHGLDALVEITLAKLPDFIKSGFAAAQKVNVEQKRIACEEIIFEFAVVASNGFWDKVPLVDLFTTNSKIMKMFKKICQMYNTILTEKQLDSIAKEFKVKKSKLMKWLLNPVSYFKNKELSNFVNELKGQPGLDVEKHSFTNSERAAQMIVFYGYKFMKGIEEVWENATDDELKDIDEIVKKIRDKMRDILTQRFEDDLQDPNYAY